ncbi:MAG: MFS transporter [Gammaproteobacteria bacterium]|nr:MFS transporter [Gammaproteobacteria bacterium]MYK28966.1 MFS transporter [Gammaproteobacteria bacterium]
MNGSSERLTPTQRIGYGVGDFGINLFFISTLTYLLYFYTDVFGLSAAAAGGVMLVARVVDAVTDPLMGAIAERTRSRWGRLRPYILFGALPLGASAVLTFASPAFSDSGKLWWAYLTYIAFSIAFTVVSVPYSALTASLTADYQERTVLSTIRMACAFGGGLAISVGMPILVGTFDTEAEGYLWSMLIFAALATPLLALTFAQTEERIQPPAAQRLAIRDSLRAVFINPPLLVVMVMFSCGMLSFTVRQAVAIYYFKYNLGRPDLIETWFLATLSIMFVGLVFTPKLADQYGKPGGILIGAVVTIAAALGLYFTPYDQIELIFLWGCLLALGGTPIAVLGWAMIPDTVDYAQARFGVRADGSVFAMSSFFQKLAKALGGAGVAAVLALAGYVANAEQTAASLDAIRSLMTLAPAAIMVVMIVAALSYPLSRQAHAALVSQLKT